MEESSELNTLELLDEKAASLLTDQCVIREFNNITGGFQTHTKESVEDAAVHFKLHIFLKEFIYHITHVVPIIILVEGFNGAYNRSFAGLQIGTFEEWLFWAPVVAVNVIYFLYWPPGIFYYEIALMDLLWLFRTAVVATKYAYFSPKDLHILRSKKVDAKARLDRQLLGGWRSLPKHLIDQELQLAAVRQKVDLSKFQFIAIGEKNQPEILPASTVAAQLVSDAADFTSGPWVKITFLLAAIHGLLPIIIRAAAGQNVFGGASYSDWPAIFVTCWLVLLNTFFCFSNYGYVAVGVVDFFRRSYIYSQLYTMVDRGFVRRLRNRKNQQSTVNLLHKSVTIDLSHPKNVMSWFSMRQVLQDFGYSYYRRINIYAAYLALYVSILIVFVLISALLPQLPKDTIIVAFAIYDALIFNTLLVVMANEGGRCNNWQARHPYVLLSKQLDVYRILEEKKGTIPPKETALMEAAAALMSTTVDSVRAGNHNRSIRILGFEAGGQLLTTFMAVFLSALAAGAKAISDAIQGM